MSDPFGPSSDPDIPTPKRENLLPHVHGSVRDQLAAGTLDAKHAENEWRGARRQWDEAHKRDADRRRAEEAKQAELPPAEPKPFDGVFPEFDPSQVSPHPKPPGEFDDTPALSGTKVPGQTADDKTPPKPTEKELRRSRIQQANSRGEFADPHDVVAEEAENEADTERYRRGLAEARDKQSGIQILRDEVDRAGKVMGQATELLRHKASKPPTEDPRSRPDSHNKIVGWVKNNPFWTAAAAFAAWQLPLGIAQVWPVLVRDKTIPEWVAESRWPGMTPHVYGWLSVIFFVTLIILAMIITVSRKGEKSKGDKSR